MYSEKVMDHFTNPRNVGEIENASGVGTVGNARCGDIMRIYLDIDDDGNVICYHMNKEVLDKAIKMIEDIVKDVEIGAVYTVKVVKIEDFGAFVELWPGCEGLVHVSQLDNKRVNHPSDILKVGDEIVVKAIGYDRKGKLNLSRKELLPKPEKKEDKKEEKKHSEE